MKAAEMLLGRHQRAFSRTLGPSLLLHLEDPDVIELQANPDGSLFLHRHSSGLTPLELTLHPGHTEARNLC